MGIQDSLAVPSLSLHPLPSLSSNYLNLLLGTQGGSWRLEPTSYKQETGDTEGLPSPGATQGPLGFSNNDKPTQCNIKINEKAFYELVWKDRHDVLFTESIYNVFSFV